MSLHHHFAALLKAIEPSKDRQKLASELPGQVRDWLQEHEFKTEWPHSRLIGSYQRCTAIQDIKDIDILLFVPESQLDRTPNAVLLEVKKVLDDYPDATAEASGQRRSVHLEFPGLGVHLDIVPAVAKNGLESSLLIPDRPGEEWIDSDPLGYGRRLSELNQDHNGRVVPLMKMIKAWRNVQMKVRKPKSYVLEVMILYAVESGKLVLVDRSYEEIVSSFFSYIAKKYEKLMEEGSESPRIYDPQITDCCITRGWPRADFETFMRRIQESDKAAGKALAAESDEEKVKYWKSIFGDLWPGEDQVKAAVRAEAAAIQPGRAYISGSGNVLGSVGVLSRSTKYYGR